MSGQSDIWFRLDLKVLEYSNLRH